MRIELRNSQRRSACRSFPCWCTHCATKGTCPTPTNKLSSTHPIQLDHHLLKLNPGADLGGKCKVMTEPLQMDAKGVWQLSHLPRSNSCACFHRTPQADDPVPDAPQVLASCLDDLHQTDPIVLLLCALPYILFRVHILVLQSKH